MKKRLIFLTSSVCAIFLTLTPALAHVVVKPIRSESEPIKPSQ